ncbi:MAG: YaaC family protein [Thermoactinomyces sp.]
METGSYTRQGLFHNPLSLFGWLNNEEFARKFLLRKYRQAQFREPERFAYKNVQAFTAYIRQALSLFQTARLGEKWSQPLLLYYGMMNFIKAWILAKNPFYPENTAVLRHGLSTRKRKKEQFRFRDDEIRIQKEGLFPLLAMHMGVSVQPGNTYSVKDLLGLLPDLQEAYQLVFEKSTLFPARWVLSAPSSPCLVVSEKILDECYLTSTAFVEKLNQQVKQPLFSLANPAIQSGNLCLACSLPDPELVKHPWLLANKNGDYYLYAGNNRPQPLPEVMCLFMLCFAMSMLCRYDPPLWEEIMLHPVHQDQLILEHLTYFIICQFPESMASLFLSSGKS